MRVFRSLRAAALLLAMASVGCDSAVAPTAPVPPKTAAPTAAPANGLIGDLLGGAFGVVNRLVCPTDQARTGSAVVGPEGGALVVDGFRVDFPAGAVAQAETFDFELVPGRYLEIEVHARGYAHYQFATPVTVTLDMARCGGVLPSTAMRAWHIDSQTKALLEPMGGVFDASSNRFRFQTPHFSGYTIAW